MRSKSIIIISQLKCSETSLMKISEELNLVQSPTHCSAAQCHVVHMESRTIVTSDALAPSLPHWSRSWWLAPAPRGLSIMGNKGRQGHTKVLCVRHILLSHLRGPADPISNMPICSI